MDRRTLKDSSIDAIAKRLIATRKAFGLSQYEFASKAGIADNTYNQYEKAKNRPNLDFAFRLCEAYGLSLDWIYFGDPSSLSFQVAQKVLAELDQQDGGAKQPEQTKG